MKKSFLSIFSAVAALSVITLISFNSCEIGLGSSVDVEAPKIEFANETVASGAVIRDAFAVFGSWEDDGSIESITATLRSLSDSNFSIERAGELIEDSDSWKIAFDPAHEGIADGPYEISVLIVDTAGHESIISRTVTIDNTPPLVVLSRPSTKAGADSFDSYGQKFTLEGKAADDNDVSLIEVNVYGNAACTGDPIKTITLPNVPLTIETDVATYDKSAANDYAAIYGHVDASGIALRDGTDVTRYCKLVVYDGAQRYPANGGAQSEADRKGNSVEYYYLNSDLAELFTAGYKITELHHILNNTYSASGSRSVSAANVASLLKNPEKQVSVGQFKLNPENSPHFVVSARNPLPENLEDPDKLFNNQTITNGNSKLEIEISPGLDGHLIKKETVGVYLLRCDKNGNLLNSSGTIVTDEKLAKKVWLIEPDKQDLQADITESGSTYKFKTKTEIRQGSDRAKEMVIGEYYLIRVVGKDMQPNDIVSEGNYGFYLETSGVNINVSATVNPNWNESEWITNKEYLSTNPAAAEPNKSIEIKLDYPLDNKDFGIWRGTSVNSLTRIDAASEDAPYATSDVYTDTSIISGLGISTTNHPSFIYYKVKGQNSAETAEPKSVQMKYDDTPPVVSIPSVPDADSGRLSSITFEGNATDVGSGINRVYVQIIDYDDDSLKTGEPPAIGKEAAAGVLTATASGGKWSLSVKHSNYSTGAFRNEGKKKIIVTAEDGVGLRTDNSNNPAIYIFDKNDPTVDVNAFSSTITGVVAALSGTASDTWGLKEIKIVQEKGSDKKEKIISNPANGNWTVDIPFKADGGAYYQSEIDNGNADGSYKYTVIVTDKADKHVESKPVSIQVYSVKPVVNVSNFTASESTTPWQTITNDITITGTARVSSSVNGASIAGVYYKLLDSEPSSTPDWSSTAAEWTSATAGATNAQGIASWSQTETIDDTETPKHLYVVAVDNAGNVSTPEHVLIKVDTSKPDLTSINYKIGSTALTSANANVKPGTIILVDGTYKDPHSGAQPLVLKLGDRDCSANVLYSSDGTTYVAHNETNSKTYQYWKASITTTTNDSGKFTITGKNYAAPASSAVSSTSSFDLIVDGENPDFVNLKLVETDSTGTKESYSDQTSKYHINNTVTGKNFKLSGSATDNVGVEKITFSVIRLDNNGNETSDPPLSISDMQNPARAWEQSISGWNSWTGGARIKVTATDKAGNVKTETFDVVFDTAQPTASIDTSSWKDSLWISGTGKVYINGASSDASSIKSITMKLDNGAASIVPVANPWTYELDCTNLQENGTSDSDKHTLTLVVTDNCGNSKTVIQDFKLDKSTPVIKNLTVKDSSTGTFTKDIKNVNASGAAWDGVQNKYRPVTVTISAVDSDELAADIGGINKVITATTSITNNSTFGSFNQAVATNTLSDGEYIFTVKATDYAGNEAEEKVTITVDNTPPEVNTASLDSWNTTGSAATITATFTEENPDSAYYYINDGSNPSLTQEAVRDADWVSMNVNGTTATKSCTFSDGKGVVYIKVVDKAGNFGFGTPIDYEVDTKAPDVCTLLTVDGAALTGSKLINGSNDVVFTVNATDYNDNRNSSGTVIGSDPTRVSSVKLTKIGDDTYTGSAVVDGVATLSGGTTGPKTGEWTITIPMAKFTGKTSGSFPVTVTVTDTSVNGKTRSKEYQLFTLDIDQERPTLNSYTLTSSYDAGEVAGVQTFYMNNSRDPFTLTGIAKDDREIDEVTLTIKDSSGNVLKTDTSNDSAWTFTSTNTAAQGQASNAWTTTWNGWTDYVTVELSVKDKAQNVVASPTTFKIIFDTIAPAALHKFDSSEDGGKDIYFRVGDQERDDGSATTNGTTTWTPVWSDSLDKDVGGKYKSGTFGNKETIKIRGNFEEAGSGIAMIYYKLYKTNPPTPEQIAAFLSSPAENANGYFGTKPASETTRRVFYTGDITGITKDGTTGGKNYKSIASTYLTTISDFKAGHNYLVLVAVDNVGNAAVDNITNGYYSINVDTQAPETAAITDVYTNGKDEAGNDKDLKLAFTVTDYPIGTGSVSAGIKSVKVKMNGVAEEKTAALDETANSPTFGKYVATIPASELPGTGTYTVSVTALDYAGAGNPDSRVVGSVIVDKTDPQVRVTSTSGWIKNSIDGASVYVSDANGLKKNAGNNEFVTYNVYSASDTSYANPLLATDGIIEVSNNEATIPTIATTDTSKFVDGISYIVRFTAEDSVGNKAHINTGNYTIDRTIPLLDDAVSGIDGVTGESDVEATGKYFKSETLPVTGSFTDRAGSVAGSGVKTINYTLTPVSGTPITGSWSSADGSYSTNLAGFENGTNTLTLSAVDAMSNTSAETTYTIKVDNIAPTISEVPDPSNSTVSDPEYAFTKIKLTNGTGTRIFKFNVTDSDSGFDTSVANITVKAGSRSITNEENGSKISVDENTVTVTIGAADLTALSGNNSVTVTVMDKAGNRSNSERIGVLNVDKDPPHPEFTSHQENAVVNKKITLSGKVTDPNNSAITAIALTANCGSVTKHYAFPAGTTGSDGDISYANGLWSLILDTEDFNSTVTAASFSLSLTATDEADNTSDAEPLTLSIDQNTDRPVVKFTNLTKEGSSYILKYGNDAQLEGTVSDDDGTSTAVVKEFKASSTQFTYSTNTSTGVTTFTGITGNTDFDSSTGDFTFTPSNTGDGSKDVYFYIKDNNDNEFYTKTTSSQLARPYQQYKTDAPDDNSNALTYMSDSKAPVFDAPLLQAYTEDADDKKNGSQTQLGDNCKVGGETKNYIDITVSARDDNGIKKIEITANGRTYDSTVDTDGTQTTDDEGKYIFTTNRIDINSLVHNTVSTVNVKVYDNSGLYSNQDTSFKVDRESPTIDITTPASDGVTYYGTIKQNIAAGIIGGGDAQRIYFTVSEADNLTEADINIDITSTSALSASIVFDNNIGSTENGFHSKFLHDWIKDLRPATDPQWANYNIEENDTNVPLYVYYKAVDDCGNTRVQKRLINVIPNGDKPTVTISYPENKEDEQGHLTVTPALAGTIRLYGTTDIQAYSVDSVYIQLASNYTTTPAYNWDNWIIDLATVDGSAELSSAIVEIPFSGTKQADGTYINNKRGIKASGTPDNWNLPINGDGIFETVNRNMAIRVFAVSDSGTDEDGNKKGKVSDAVVQAFNIDKSAPRIGGNDGSEGYSLQLVQFEDSKEGNLEKIAKRAPYKADMWVTGNWYLLATVHDENGIRSITLDEHKNAGVKKLVDAAVKKSIKTVDSKDCYVTDASTGTGNFNICIPLPTGSANTSGSITYTIEATENTIQNLSSVETIRINYDNTPPKIGTQDYTIDSEVMALRPQVYDEDGFYKLKGYVSDSGTNASGLLGVAFYFVRRGSKNYVYDPMYYRKNHVSIAAAKDANAADLANNDIVYANGLYWKHKTLETRTDTLNQISLAASDVNIHKGGLVMLGGQIYKIKNLSSDGETITLYDNVPKSITTADFALAMLVDNRNGESQNINSQALSDNTAYAYGYCNVNDDDGDRMLEKLGGDTEGRWEASIHSKNIPDGPIEIHYVAFDKAQNYTVGIIGNIDADSYESLTTKDAVEAVTLKAKASTSEKLTSYYQYNYTANNKAKISNNAPRIASVTIGTDYNGNGSYEDSEKRTEYAGGYYTINENNKAKSVKDSWILSSDGTATGNAKYIIKDKTQVSFEVIGGNTNIYYQYSIDDSYKEHDTISTWSRDNKAGGGYNPMTITRIKDDQNKDIEGKALDPEGRTYYNASELSPVEFALNTIKTKVTTNKTAWWTIELWDETEDTTIFSDSQYAELKLPLSVQIYDDIAPNTVINSLYWNSKDDNSVYQDSEGNLLGHVELIKDLTYKNAQGQTITTQLGSDYDATDDKVSGTVVFRGYAYDNKRLSKLDWAIMSSTGTALWDYTAGAEFTNSGAWDNKGSLATDKYEFKVKTAPDDANDSFNSDGSEAYLDEKGHKVYWELAVDTSNINGVVAENAKLYIRATDAAEKVTVMTGTGATGSPSASDITQEAIDKATKAPTYQVDILPYIKNVQTSLSSLKANNPSVYSRTALGHYSVRVGETVTFEGFNLGENTTLPISDSMDSAAYEFKVGNIKAMNNLNNNDARGSYTKAIVLTDANGRATSGNKSIIENYYNRQPNGDNNNLLTDDIWFDVWQFNNRAAVPITGKIEQPVMKIRPTDGKIGFAFVNGPLYFSMGGSQSSQNYSYQYWAGSYDLWSSIGFTYDSFGNSYGVGAGGDSNAGEGDAFILASSKFGLGQHTDRGSYDGQNALRLERIGQYNGTAFDIDKQKIKSPSIVSSQNGTDKTNLYLAYYDGMNDEIRFKSGTESTPSSWIRKVQELDGNNYTGAWVYLEENGDILACEDGDSVYFCDANGNLRNNTEYKIYSLYKDEGIYNAAPANGKKEWAFQITRNGTVQQPFTQPLGKNNNSYNNYQQGHRGGFKNISGDNVYIKIVANTNTTTRKHEFGQFRDSATDSSPDNYAATAGYVSILASNTTTYKTGDYLSLGVVPASVTGGNDRVVAVWLDQENPALPILRYAYNSDPIDNPGSWTYVERVLPASSSYSYAGEYCKVAVDQNGGVHIAAYDQKNLDLIYAYLPADKKGIASGAGDFKTCIVDSNGVVGSNLNIDVGLNGEGKVVPYISYYATSIIRPKLAYYVGGFSATDTIEAGSVNDLHTTKWECANVPTESNVEMQSLQHNDINVGLWKEAGVIVDSSSDNYTKGTSSTTNQPNAYNSVSNGQIYGNGTANPVLGYAIKINSKSGAIETAQMR